MLEEVYSFLWDLKETILAIIAISVSIYLYIKQRRTKSLEYDIDSITELLSVKDEIKGDLEIKYKGSLIENVHLIIIKIINTGNVPILGSDFDDNLTIEFNEDATVISEEVIEKNPNDFEIFTKINMNSIELSNTLWNEGDYIIIKTLVTNFKKEIMLKGRIVGVREIKKLMEGSIITYIGSIIGAIIVLLSLVFMFIDILFISDPTFTISNVFIPLLVGYVLIFVSSVKDERVRKAIRKIGKQIS